MVFSVALASPVSQAADDAAQPPDALTEIIVVAQKRAENLQKVPISIEALTPERLAASGVQTFQDLSSAVPGLTMLNVSGSISPRLRGVGTSTVEAGIEPAVATYVDGVYYAYSADLVLDLSDVSKVTVLKGPQGTLFGRNATGGVIQIDTREPSRVFEADITTSIDNYLTSRTSGHVSGSLTDEVSAGLSVQYTGQGMGYGENIYDDTSTQKIDHAVTVRGKMVINVDDRTTVRLGADYSNREDSIAANFRPFPDYSILFPVPQTSSPWGIDSYIHNYKSYDGGGGAAIIEHDWGFATLTSTSAFRDAGTFIHFNPAATAVPSEDISYPESSRQATEELQLVSRSGGRWDWATGMFYFYSLANLADFNANLYGPLVTRFDQLVIVANESIKSLAGYAQGTYKFSPSTRITVGGRYTYQENVLHGSEHGELASSGGDVILVGQPNPDSVSSAKPTWRLALDHDFTDSILGYVSYNRGSKSGGFNVRDPSNPPFLPEQLDAYEVGWKSELVDHRIRLNTAAFDYEYENIQISKFTTTQVIENGAKARIYGLDGDLTVDISDALRISAGIEWLHARFLDFPDAPFTVPLPGRQGAILTSGNAGGMVIPYSPAFAGTFGADYTIHTSAGKAIINVTDGYSSGFYGEPDNRLFQSSFQLLNASISWLVNTERWGVRLYANNLFNKAVASQISSLNVGYVAVYSNPPRTCGASVHFSL